MVESGARALLGAVFGPLDTREIDYARDHLPLLDRGFDAEAFLAGIGRAVLADLLLPRRPRTSVRKLRSPLLRYNKKDPYRPELSTPITTITATIADPTRNTDTELENVATALGP